MLCPHCGAKVEESYKYCPTCGANFENARTSLAENSQLVQKKPMPLWFKILAALAVIALIGVTAGILFTESLVDVIDHQLVSLRKENIDKAYYSYTAKEFQQATSLDAFKTFVNTYPIFIHNQSAHFTQRSIKDNIGTLKGNLTSPEHEKVPVEYKLIKEEGKWKILSIRLLKPAEVKPPDASAESLNELIKNQLEELKQNKIANAYENYSSKEFKEATSLDNFIEFVKKYPALSNQDSFSISKTLTRNEVGIVSVTLNQNETATYLKYYLVHEDNAWKIWSMRILSPEEQKENLLPHVSTEQKQMQFTDVQLGVKINSEGVIQNPSTTFKANSDKIYANVKITNGIKGEMIQLNFQHIESRSSILTKAVINDDGDSILVSTFTPPVGGWPKGNYQLIASSSSGLKQTIVFHIE
jgi:hypothetical protein